MPTIIGLKDVIFKQRGAARLMNMLLYDWSEFKHHEELYHDAAAFLQKAKKIGADDTVTPEEFQDLVIEFQNSKDLDFVTAVLGTFVYRFNKDKFPEVIKGIDDEKMSKTLAVLGSNLIKYFVTLMAELGDDLGIIASTGGITEWRKGRGITGAFLKGQSKDDKKKLKVRQAVTVTYQKKIFDFWMNETRRGKLVGGLNPGVCRKNIVAMCKSFKIASDAFDVVLGLGNTALSTPLYLRNPTKRAGKVEVKEEEMFDMTRFLVGLNDFRHHKSELVPIKRQLQVLIAQMIYVLIVKTSYLFRAAELTEKTPSALNMNNIRKMLENYYNVTEKQIKGLNVPIVAEPKSKTA